MIWMTWRQFRTQALTVLALTAAAATGFLISGLLLHHRLAAALAACAPANACDGSTPAARELGSRVAQVYDSAQPAFELLQVLVLAVPALLGMFWGAPLIGRELETGTHQLAWSQTVTRTRWLATKLAVVGAAAIAVAAVFSLLMTWWAAPLDDLNGNRWPATTFATRDLVPLGYAAFTFALAATLGLLLRRTLPAMAVTLVVFVAVQLFVPGFVRPHLLPATTTTYAIDEATASSFQGYTGTRADFHFALPTPRGAWLTDRPPVQNAAGQAVSMDAHAACFPGLDGDGSTGEPDFGRIGACLAGDNLHQSVTYHPASHYWPLQWMETGLLFALAGALAATCFWSLRRRQQ
ncbi:ABC transporter permease subunit [Dactylosporangium sp. CS-047395]|uniref:ABC transporter permease subunit n=1 Tax=Dactylosporangium sp. CS-047395 TaxID=3239936 RepID=UPI003D8E3F9A